LAALVSAIAPLANPYGWHLYAHVFRYLTDSELLARIGEFQSFDFHAPGSWPIIVTLLVGVAGGTLALLGGRPEHFALAMLLTAWRCAPPAPAAGALLLLPLANAAITATLRRAAVLDGFLTYSARLRAIDARFSGLALVPLVLLAAFALLRLPSSRQPRVSPRPVPRRGISQVARLPAAARLFAPDKFGGYLIYRSQGARKVFFDGRSDLYGADFLKQYARMVQCALVGARPGILSTSPTPSSQRLLPHPSPGATRLGPNLPRPNRHPAQVGML